MNQDLMNRITFHDARHMKDAGHVPYGGVFKQTNAQDAGNRVVSCHNDYSHVLQRMKRRMEQAQPAAHGSSWRTR